jgi:hypothetical protein
MDGPQLAGEPRLVRPYLSEVSLQVDAEGNEASAAWQFGPDDTAEGPPLGRHRMSRVAHRIVPAQDPVTPRPKQSWVRSRWGVLAAIAVMAAGAAGVILVDVGQQHPVDDRHPAGALPFGAWAEPSRSRSPSPTMSPGPGVTVELSAAPTGPVMTRTASAPASSPGLLIPSTAPAPESTVPTSPPSPPAAPTLLPIVGRTSTIVGIHGRCLDDERADTTNGTLIQLWDCIGERQQVWTMSPSGALSVVGKCMQAAGGGTAGGSRVELWACTGTAAQQWQFTSAGQLVNKAAGLCLNDPSAGTDYGIQLNVAACQNVTGQRFTMS